MRFEHRFRVKAGQEAVAAFHQSAGSLRSITPLPMKVHHAPAQLGEGAEIVFTVWMGPLPVRWHGRVENASAEGFDDIQLAGPFRSWRHRHNFQRLDANTTEVYDAVQAELRPHPVWGLVGLMMWLGLPALFAYRGWRTRRLVEGKGKRWAEA